MLTIDPRHIQHPAQCLDRVLFIKYPRHHLELDAEVFGYFLSGPGIILPATVSNIVRAIMLAERELALGSDLQHLRCIMLNTLSRVFVIVDDPVTGAIGLMKPNGVLVVLGF